MSDEPGKSRRRIILWCAIAIGLCLCAILSLSGCRRPDDVLEPNNDFGHATRLVAGQAVTARANQGNGDFFAIHAEAGQTIVFRLQSLGLEDRPAFSIFGPDKEVLYRDYFSLYGPRYAEIQAEGVTSADIKDFGYELCLPAEVSGTYYLLIRERHRADNIFPFSWDYRLTATVDSVTATPAPTAYYHYLGRLQG